MLTHKVSAMPPPVNRADPSKDGGPTELHPTVCLSSKGEKVLPLTDTASDHLPLLRLRLSPHFRASLSLWSALLGHSGLLVFKLLSFPLFESSIATGWEILEFDEDGQPAISLALLRGEQNVLVCSDHPTSWINWGPARSK